MKNWVGAVLVMSWSFGGITAGAQTAPPPAPVPAPAPLTQRNTGLTQKNTSGLSQNMMGRTGTSTDTNTAISPGVMYPGIAVPQSPRALNIGPGSPSIQTVPATAPTASPGVAVPAPAAPEAQVDSLPPEGQVAPPAPANGSGGAMPETTGNE